MNLFSSRGVFLAAFCASALVAQAGDLDTAKKGMRERVAVIDKLKSAGAIGEGHNGLVAKRADAPMVDDVVAAENADRTVVFAELAKKSGGTSEEAGESFARQIATASKAGVWLQREDGGWYKK
jgi:uncharacterized protein YdbL (DUF1318 family)